MKIYTTPQVSKMTGIPPNSLQIWAVNEGNVRRIGNAYAWTQTDIDAIVASRAAPKKRVGISLTFTAPIVTERKRAPWRSVETPKKTFAGDVRDMPHRSGR